MSKTTSQLLLKIIEAAPIKRADLKAICAEKYPHITESMFKCAIHRMRHWGMIHATGPKFDQTLRAGRGGWDRKSARASEPAETFIGCSYKAD